MEKAFEADLHVRGNEITITGDPAENATAERASSRSVSAEGASVRAMRTSAWT